jgi:hypothetical protein
MPLISTFYYSLGFIFLILELLTIRDGRAWLFEFIQDHKDCGDDSEKLKVFFKNNLVKIIWIFLFLLPVQILYFLWTVAGLFTPQIWPFLGLIFLGFSHALLPKFIKSTFTARIDAIISFGLILFILLQVF